MQLVAEHEDGSVTVGESRISQAPLPIRRLYLEPANPPPTQEALTAIREADAIILGPGSLYTSIIPNLLVDGLVEAIVQSKALKLYVCNVMTQFRETTHFKASDHVRTLVAHTNPGIVQVCVVNVNTKQVPAVLLEKYRQEHAHPVEADVETIRRLGYQVVADDVMSAANYVRHDSDRLARLLIDLTTGARRLSMIPPPPRRPTASLPVREAAAAQPAEVVG